MRIIEFCKNIDETELSPYELKNCPVVIDGINFFCHMFNHSNWTFVFGCESDKYADDLKKKLSLFKKANVQCYFVFKGGDAAISQKDFANQGYNLNDLLSRKTIVMPIFMKEIYKQVLDDMNFNYVVSEFEAKEQCIALAQKLNCPIISYDITFCFSDVPYIPFNKKFIKSMDHDDSLHAIDCGIFRLREFMTKYNLNKDKLATFIVLRDEKVFPEGQNVCSAINLLKLYGKIKLYDFMKLNLYLLRWLSINTNDHILSVIRKSLNSYKFDDFVKEKNRFIELICKKVTPDLPVHYLMNGNHVDFDESDPSWFSKGVVAGHISIQYVNLYRWNTIYGSWTVDDDSAQDSMMLSVGIIKYAFNLLTNFQRKEIKFAKTKYDEFGELLDATAIQKPPYEAVESPFENGWERIKSLRFFEYFLDKSMESFNFSSLTSLPEDARLLVIALVYFSHQKPLDTTTEVCSVLLSHVMLGVVSDEAHNNNRQNKNKVAPKAAKPTNDCTAYKELVTNEDSKTAKAIMTEYLTISDSETYKIFDRKLLHPLVEFQHCLHQMNFLNKLCGCPYMPTVYSRTYNGTFIYKILYDIKVNHSVEAVEFLKGKLAKAPTVLSYFNDLKGVYDQIMYR